MASVCVMAAQQACGVSYIRLFDHHIQAPNILAQINILAFTSTTMYAEMQIYSGSGLTSVEIEKSLLFSVYFGLTNFL